MTAANVDATADSMASGPVAATPPSGRATVARGCPYLLADEGGWRLDMPSRDHRCAAFSPPAPLAIEKQGRLCLTAGHTSCATYLASLAAREARLGTPPATRATRWGLARTTTVIEDPGGVRARVAGALLDRRRWPAVPAVLLIAALLGLAASGFRPGLPASADSSPVTPSSQVAAITDAPTPTPAPTPSPEPSVAPTASPTVAPTASPTAAPTKKPKPTFRTYVVESGDTLSRIAARFHTTVSAIATLNGISDPSKLRVGQVLLIPN